MHAYSGSDREKHRHLTLMGSLGPNPWELSLFSLGRALGRARGWGMGRNPESKSLGWKLPLRFLLRNLNPAFWTGRIWPQDSTQRFWPRISTQTPTQRIHQCEVACTCVTSQLVDVGHTKLHDIKATTPPVYLSVRLYPVCYVVKLTTCNKHFSKSHTS